MSVCIATGQHPTSCGLSFHPTLATNLEVTPRASNFFGIDTTVDPRKSVAGKTTIVVLEIRAASTQSARIIVVSLGATRFHLRRTASSVVQDALWRPRLCPEEYDQVNASDISFLISGSVSDATATSRLHRVERGWSNQWQTEPDPDQQTKPSTSSRYCAATKIARAPQSVSMLLQRGRGDAIVDSGVTQAPARRMPINTASA